MGDKWVNATGEVHYVKYTWKSVQGVKNLRPSELSKVQGENVQHASDDLQAALKRGDFPSWDLYVQVLTPEQLDQFDFNPLDATKVWPVEAAPLVKAGRMTLDRWPSNVFEETEMSAFSPATLVPGIEPSEDRLLQGRLFSYFDTQRHRLGGNFQQIKVNSPAVPVNTFNQQGYFSARNTGDVNYQPSRRAEGLADQSSQKLSTRPLSGATQQRKISKTNDFTQAGALYRSFREQDRQDLIANLSGDLAQVKNPAITLRMVSHFYKADADYGTRLAKALGLNPADVQAEAGRL